MTKIYNYDTISASPIAFILRIVLCCGKGERFMTEYKKQIDYAVVCVSEFARKYNMRLKAAFHFLYQYKAIQFIKENYEIEHTLSFEEVVEDMLLICKKNGGIL